MTDNGVAPVPALDELLAELTLPEKVDLITGRDFWSTQPIEKIGLRSMVLSDGPSGIRGAVWDERSPSLNLPSASALSSSWSTTAAREFGQVAAAEAIRKGVDVVLGPTVNLHRSPLGGRHFEAFSEDPVLTAALAAAYVSGVQHSGVAATPKHYVANDFETDRFTADVAVSDRALRELYLLAFERAITESHAWVVMSAYNSINGTTASESALLETPLNSEWGFDGVVVSDWTAVRSIAAASASQDLAMPGPDSPWGPALVAAVERGEVDEADIDRKVLRILRLAQRVGALDGHPVTRAPSVVDGVGFARRAAADGAVLVRNNGILPVTGPVQRIAVIGHNADAARSQGGGSATVVPEHVVSPLEGIIAAFPDSQVDDALGAVVQAGLSDLPLDQLRNPSTGEPGVRVSFLSADGSELFAEDRFATSFVWIGGDAPVGEAASIEVRTSWTPTVDGVARLGFAGVGHGTLAVTGTILLDETVEVEGTDLGAALLSPPSRSASVRVVAGEPLDLVATYRRTSSTDGLGNAAAFSFGREADNSDPEGLIAQAVALAERADLVVLVVGTNSSVESEGFDRTDLRLPGTQDTLAARVLAANPNSVVVVNAGAPVELPWADDAAAILISWFGGQEMGSALGDVLNGNAEPGGRLPTTWPVRIDDVPVLDVTPVDGVVRYDEGIHIGYRAWLRAGVEPRFWFGWGLGYTEFSVGALAVAPVGDGVRASVEVTNAGQRRGKHVVQLYASRPESRIDRPVRWLCGFATVDLDPGESTVVVIDVPRRAFAHWDGAWAYEPGAFTLAIGTDAGTVSEGVAVTV